MAATRPHPSGRLVATIQLLKENIPARQGLSSGPYPGIGDRSGLKLNASQRRLCDFFAKSYSPIHASTYVENVAGQVRPLVRERLSARLSFSGAHMTFFALVRSLKGQRASQAAGFAALAIAAAALISWWAGLETLSSGG